MTKEQKAAFKQLERSLGNPRGGISNAQLDKAIKDMQKVRKEIGDTGKGVEVIYKGSNTANGKPRGAVAYALIGKGSGVKEIEIYGDYFSPKYDTSSGMEIVHEMGHNTLGLGDKMSSALAAPDNQSFFPVPGDLSQVYAYRWPGVDRATANGLKINDSFTCSVGFDDC